MLAKGLKSLIGLALLALGIFLCVIWWGDLLTLIRGSLGLFLILVGLIAFALVAD